jgi:hypothetical protein
VTFTKYVPSAVEVAVMFSVDEPETLTLFGFRVTWRLGEKLAVSDIEPLKPSIDVTFTVPAALEPCEIDSDDGVALTPKS